MKRTPALLLIACAAVFVVVGPLEPAHGAPDLSSIRVDFLRTRDAARLVRDLESIAARKSGLALPVGLPSLALWAKGTPPTAGAGETVGNASGDFAVLARVVVAYRGLDLAAVRKAIGTDAASGSEALAWTEALLRLRMGDDVAAVSRLLAPPLFDWERDAFKLALLGAALSEDDRRMLAAGAMGALERAASRNRASAVESMALAMAALHPHAGRQAFPFALRAFRRSDNIAAAQALLAQADAIGVHASEPEIALEAALIAWEVGGWKDIAALLDRGQPPAGARGAFLALRHAQRRGKAIDLPLRPGHVRGDAKHAHLIAQLASALGRRTDAADVTKWAEAQGTKPWHAAAAQRFFSQQGLDVLGAVGDAAVGDALLQAGIPFLLFRIQRGESAYREVPALVRGSDRRTGLWLLAEPDAYRVDVVPRADIIKARIVCAVPRAQAALLTRFRALPPARHARQIETAIQALDDSRYEPGIRGLPAATAKTAGEQVYRAYGLHRAATAKRNHDWLVASREAVERSRTVPPLLGIEAYIYGQALAVRRETEAALASYDNVVRLEGPTATVAMARFAALDQAKDLPGALEAVMEAQRLAPLDSRVLFFRASVRSRAGDRTRARSDLRRALERTPERLHIALSLARLEVMDGQPKLALEILRDVERRIPGAKDDPALRLERRAAEFALLEAATSIAALAWARRSSEPETRRRLAYELAQRHQGGAEAEGLLRLLLADPDPDVRVSTLRVYLRPWLQDWIEKDSILSRRITNLLSHDEDPLVRGAAATLFGRVGCRIACRALTAALAGEEADKDPRVRTAAARALAAHERGRHVREALVSALEDESQDVRQASIDVLFQATATTRDYEADADPAARAAAVANWKAWLKE